MCGLTGFWETDRSSRTDERDETARHMADALAHRGPDDFGVWQDASAGLVLAFRRLAIRDLSPAGHQPMLSASGRFALVFNGEVYNVDEMRAELAACGRAPNWRGTSDTETMLAAIEAWGVSAAASRFVGMFAMALWDREQHTLSLVRDRLGIKPVYYGWMGRSFLFGSELKALRAHPAFSATLDREALSLFLRFAYVPSPCSIYENIRKLPPASILTVSADGESKLETYWSLAEVATDGLDHPFEGSDDEAIDAFLAQVREAVRLRMIADVPLGAFLSGGLDSSLVVALMQEASARPVQTFCIGFTEESYNEADQAREVARHLGTDHHERLATPAEAMAVIPRLPTLYDEPFADPSQIPTFLVSELARTKVTVSLSGDGGDELLAGYNAYSHGEQIRAIRRRLGPLTPLAATAIKAVPPRMWQTALRGSYSGDRLHKLADVLSLPAQADHPSLMSHWRHPDMLTTGGHPALPFAPTLPDAVRHASPILQAMYADTLTYLPDDILTKVDRASMGVALEARVPLLDHRLVGFCWSLPLELKRREGKTKWIMRKALERYLPRELFDRPKRGFGVPIDAWLRGPLRPWAEELLSEPCLSAGGMLNPAPIRKAWQAHLSGVRNLPGPLWCVLMLQAWREHEKI